MLKRIKDKADNHNPEDRILARKLARSLTRDEIDSVSGGMGGASCTDSRCGFSDNNPCDQDFCSDVGFPP